MNFNRLAGGYLRRGWGWRGGGGEVTAVQMAQSVPAKSPKARNMAPPAPTGGVGHTGSQRRNTVSRRRHSMLSNSAAPPGENDGRMAAHPPSPRLGPCRVRSHCRFRNRGAEYFSDSCIKWTSRSTKRQSERALGRTAVASLEGLGVQDALRHEEHERDRQQLRQPASR